MLKYKKVKRKTQQPIACEGNTELKWPPFYPENCPPPGAESASGKVYRLVRNDPPKARDFLSTWEEYPGRFSKSIVTCGTSVYTDRQDIERLKKRIPQFNDRKTAKGELNSKLGVIQRTGRRSHHTWWIPIGIKPWDLFKVIK